MPRVFLGWALSPSILLFNNRLPANIGYCQAYHYPQHCNCNCNCFASYLDSVAFSCFLVRDSFGPRPSLASWQKAASAASREVCTWSPGMHATPLFSQIQTSKKKVSAFDIEKQISLSQSNLRSSMPTFCIKGSHAKLRRSGGRGGGVVNYYFDNIYHHKPMKE